MDATKDDGTVPHASLISRFIEALMVETPETLEAARREFVDIMEEGALVDAAAVVGAFEGFTRIADATGIPTESPKLKVTKGFRTNLGIDGFAGSHNVVDFTFPDD